MIECVHWSKGSGRIMLNQPIGAVKIYMTCHGASVLSSSTTKVEVWHFVRLVPWVRPEQWTAEHGATIATIAGGLHVLCPPCSIQFGMTIGWKRHSICFFLACNRWTRPTSFCWIPWTTLASEVWYSDHHAGWWEWAGVEVWVDGHDSRS